MKKYILTATLFTTLFTNAYTQPQPTPEGYDPLEKMNRAVFSFNETLDNYLLTPVARGYKAVMPDFAEKGVSNFFDNLFTPTVIINQVLQGKPQEALHSTTRFAFNSTIGLLGLFDVATDGGIPKYNEDFGQTLGVWGFEQGPYLVLPVLGSSSVRDGVGRVGDYFTHPVTYIEDEETKLILTGLGIVDIRARYLGKDGIVSGDKYSFMRDAYLQRRAYLVKDAQVETNDPFLDDIE